MHDNAIHDLALACWIELLSPIKRAAIQTNLACSGKLSAISSEPLDTLRSSTTVSVATDYPIVSTLLEHCEIRTTEFIEGEE